MRALFSIFGVYFLLSFPLFSTPNFKEYKTDTFVLQTDLPNEFSELFLEYANGFSSLIIDFWSESRKENLKMNIHLTVYRSCRDFSQYKAERLLSGSSIYFLKLEQKSSAEFSMAGCYTNSRFFIRAFQNKFIELMLNDKKKTIPFWLKQGMVDYFENSLFLSDDSSIIPIVKNDYLIRLKQNQFDSNGNGEQLKKLLISTKKQWDYNSKINYPYTWALYYYLMDIHPKGRSILMKYIQNLKYSESGVDLLKTYELVFGFMGSSEQVSIKDLERDFHAWINALPEPKGYSKFKKLSNYNVTSSRLEILYSALEENPNFSLYYDYISAEYYAANNFRKSLEFAESSMERDFRSKSSIKRAILCSINLEEFAKAEYYLWLAAQLRMDLNEFKEIQKKIIYWRRENPENLFYQPAVKVLNFE